MTDFAHRIIAPGAVLLILLLVIPVQGLVSDPSVPLPSSVNGTTYGDLTVITTGNIPIVSIDQPESIDASYSGKYTFSAQVSGGKPPYAYRWTNCQGSQYTAGILQRSGSGLETVWGTGSEVSLTPSQITITSSGVCLQVTDSAGRTAAWLHTDNGNYPTAWFEIGYDSSHPRKVAISGYGAYDNSFPENDYPNFPYKPAALVGGKEALPLQGGQGGTGGPGVTGGPASYLPSGVSSNIVPAAAGAAGALAGSLFAGFSVSDPEPSSFVSPSPGTNPGTRSPLAGSGSAGIEGTEADEEGGESASDPASGGEDAGHDGEDSGSAPAGGTDPSSKGTDNEPQRPPLKVYGTGTTSDPYRDGNTIGHINKDGSFVSYPENAGSPPKVYGTGESASPYTDVAPPVIDHSPVPPDAPPQQPPASSPAPADQPVSAPVKDTPQPPASPKPSPSQSPAPANPPIPDSVTVQITEPAAPVQGPAPEGLTPVQRQELTEWRDRLQHNIDDLQVKWKRKHWLENVGIPEAQKKRFFQWGRTFVTPVTNTVTTIAVTDPESAITTILNGAKDKMGIKTVIDKKLGKNPFTKTGVDIPQDQIIKSFQNSDNAVRSLTQELKNMPSDEQMKDEMHRLTTKLGEVNSQLNGGN